MRGIVMKKLLALVLSILMLMSFVACGDDKKDSDTDNGGSKTETADGMIIKNKNSVTLGKAESKLDPATVYANLEYNEKMFYGSHRILGGDAAEEKYAAEQTTYASCKRSHNTQKTVLFLVGSHQGYQRKMRYLQECKEHGIHDVIHQEYVYVLQRRREMRRYPEQQHERYGKRYAHPHQPYSGLACFGLGMVDHISYDQI